MPDADETWSRYGAKSDIHFKKEHSQIHLVDPEKQKSYKI